MPFSILSLFGKGPRSSKIKDHNGEEQAGRHEIALKHSLRAYIFVHKHEESKEKEGSRRERGRERRDWEWYRL